MVQETKQQINAGENKNIRGEGLQYAILQTDEDLGNCIDKVIGYHR